MRNYVFEPWHFYKIKCLVPKPKKDGGGLHIKWKFWFALQDGEKPAGFFVNSKKTDRTPLNPLLMDIIPEDINRYLPDNASYHHKIRHESVINFRLKKFESAKEIIEAETIFQTMPKSLAYKIINFLEVSKHHIPNKRMKAMEDALKKYL